MIFFHIEFSIIDGMADAFKAMADDFIGITYSKEPDTVIYEWYVGDDDKHAVLREGFCCSEALLEHLGNVGPLLPPLVKIAPITRLEVFGNVSDGVRSALAGLGASHFQHFGGFTR